MLYPKIFENLEKSRWDLFEDIKWDIFDSTKISDVELHGIKMNAILEWSSMPTTEMFLRDAYDDPDFSAFISIWFYEEQKHSLVFVEYLKRFAPEFLPSEQELSAVRFEFDKAPLLESLVLNFCGEIRLNQWYRCAAEYTKEPLLKSIYLLLANDEARHAQVYLKYMKKYLITQEKEAKNIFAKIGTLLTSSRLNKVMHPTNLHVNKSLFPNDTVNSRLPDPKWINEWLNKQIGFNDDWENNVNKAILGTLSNLLQADFSSPQELRQYYKNSTSKKVS